MDINICSYTPEEKTLAENIIRHIRRETARKYSYLEKAIFYLEPAISEEVPYISANYTTLFFNPVNVISLYEKKPKMLEHALIHSILHCMLLHPSYNMRENAVFDAAADATVNLMLEKSGISQVYFSELFNNRPARNITDIYNTACSDSKFGKRLKATADKYMTDDHRFWYLSDQQDNGNGPGNSDSSSNHPVPGLSQISQEELRQLEKDWGSMMDAAASTCSMQYGNAPGNIFASLSPPDRFSKFSYLEYIKRFVQEEVMEDDPETIDMMLYTMGLEMYDDMPIVEWNEIREKYNPSDIIIAIDMSGSCGGDIAANFLRQIYTLFEEMDIRSTVNIHVVTFDVQILDTFVIRSKNDADKFIKNYNAHGFGGTDFNDVFRYADTFSKNASGRKLKGLFFFSDAIGDFPAYKPAYPTTFFVPGEPYINFSFIPDWVELVHYND